MEKKSWNRQVFFERGLAPSPELLADERVLGSIEARFGEIGALAFLMRRREQLVITTQRIFHYAAGLLTSRLRALELTKIETIEVGSRPNIVQFVAGLVLLGFALLCFGGALFKDVDIRLFIIYSLLSGLVGVISLLTAGQKILQVSGSSKRSVIALPLTQISVNESKRFIDLISNAIRNANQTAYAGLQAPHGQMNGEPRAIPDAARNGDELRQKPQIINENFARTQREYIE